MHDPRGPTPTELPWEEWPSLCHLPPYKTEGPSAQSHTSSVDTPFVLTWFSATFSFLGVTTLLGQVISRKTEACNYSFCGFKPAASLMQHKSFEPVVLSSCVI